jgi:hypothetical protein
MNQQARDLQHLATLAALLRERKLADLAGAVTSLKATQAQVYALNNERLERMRVLTKLTAFDAAACAGAYAKWDKILETHHLRLSDTLAQQAAFITQCREAAQIACGRAGVLDRLAEEMRQS